MPSETPLPVLLLELSVDPSEVDACADNLESSSEEGGGGGGITALVERLGPLLTDAGTRFTKFNQ
jgi:hypothetical protein